MRRIRRIVSEYVLAGHGENKRKWSITRDGDARARQPAPARRAARSLRRCAARIQPYHEWFGGIPYSLKTKHSLLRPSEHVIKAQAKLLTITINISVEITI